MEYVRAENFVDQNKFKNVNCDTDLYNEDELLKEEIYQGRLQQRIERRSMLLTKEAVAKRPNWNRPKSKVELLGKDVKLDLQKGRAPSLSNDIMNNNVFTASQRNIYLEDDAGKSMINGDTDLYHGNSNSHRMVHADSNNSHRISEEMRAIDSSMTSFIAKEGNKSLSRFYGEANSLPGTYREEAEENQLVQSSLIVPPSSRYLPKIRHMQGDAEEQKKSENLLPLVAQSDDLLLPFPFRPNVQKNYVIDNIQALRKPPSIITYASHYTYRRRRHGARSRAEEIRSWDMHDPANQEIYDKKVSNQLITDFDTPKEPEKSSHNKVTRNPAEAVIAPKRVKSRQLEDGDNVLGFQLNLIESKRLETTNNAKTLSESEKKIMPIINLKSQPHPKLSSNEPVNKADSSIPLRHIIITESGKQILVDVRVRFAGSAHVLPPIGKRQGVLVPLAKTSTKSK